MTETVEPSSTASRNPYAHCLEGRDPVAVIAATSNALASLVADLGPEGMAMRARPGGWTAHEIVCHLADTEVAFAFRLRQIMAEEHHVIQPFDQDRWNVLLPRRRLDEALDAFKVLRGGVVELTQRLADGGLTRPVTHPEFGEMTALDVVATVAGHDLNHLRQLASIRDARRGDEPPAPPVDPPARVRGGEALVDDDFARAFAAEWIDAWNSHDLSRILSHYADDFEMASPLIVEWMGEPTGVLRGCDRVAPYWRIGLAATPPLKFELIEVFAGVGSMTIHYRSVGRRTAVEVLEFDGRGKVKRGRAHYGRRA